jgi:hypothetical protein
VFTDSGQDQLSIARAADVRVLPSPQTMVAVIDAIPSHQPESRI